tara:strand:- start:644 stop:769 length:126 start_codon:yes stop_codon:yes gene_type:complete
MINNNENLEIVEPVTKEIAEHPQHVLDAIEKINLSHPDYDG